MPTSPSNTTQPLWTAVHTISPPTTSSPATASAQMNDRHHRDSTSPAPLQLNFAALAIQNPADANISYYTSLSGHTSAAVVGDTDYAAGSLQHDSSHWTDASESNGTDGNGEASGSDAAGETLEQFMRANLAALREREDGEEPDDGAPNDQVTEDGGSDAEEVSHDEVLGEEDVSDEEFPVEVPDDEEDDYSVSTDKTPSLVGSDYSSSSSDAEIEDSRFAEIVYDPLWKYLEMVRGDGARNRMRGATIRQFLRIKNAMDSLSTGGEISQEVVEPLLALLTDPEWEVMADVLDMSDGSVARDDEQADRVDETE